MSESTTPVPKVYLAMSNVLGILAEHGITKGRKNEQQGYAFRGIDDIYNFLSNSLAKEKLLIIPRTLTRQVSERETKNGGALFYVVVEMEFDFVCAIDGSKHTARMVGEAMDSADKATNKAQSAAYKYVCLQTFCIPTEGMPGEPNGNDADAVTQPTIQPANKKATPAPAAAPAAASAAKVTPTPATPAKAPQTPAKPAPAQTQVVDKVPPAAKSPVPAIADWRAEIIHFGKRQGVPLGDLEEASLVWFITKWDPNAKPGITPSAADVRLRRALDIAGASMALPGFGTPPPKDQDEIPGL